MRTSIALSIAALLLGTSVAFANPAHHGQPAPATATETAAPGGMRMMGGAGSMMGRHVEGSLAFLKTELEIGRSQESAWNSFADAYRDFAASKPAMMRHEGGMMGGKMQSGAGDEDDSAMPQRGPAMMMSFPERMKAHMHMMQEHVEAGKKFEPAVEALYDVLSAEQRKTADELLPMFTMMGGMM